MKRMNRRQFLKASGSAAAGVILSTSGCANLKTTIQAPTQTNLPAMAEQWTETSPPTSTPLEPTPTPPNLIPTFTPLPLPIVREYRRPEIIQFHPKTKSRVVHAANAQVWEKDLLSTTILRDLVGLSIVQLTGLPAAKDAWLALFNPTEKIAIKVNAFRNSSLWTHVPLVKAVTDSMTEAGIPGENITIFDYYTEELKTAGFTINKDGPSVRCYGTDDAAFGARWPVDVSSVQLSDILVGTDALINMPVLKTHGMSGITFALKNHYGCVSNPALLHMIDPMLPELNKLPPIKDATRLVIGDALGASIVGRASLPYWVEDMKGDSILMSFDPLAQDRVALDMLIQMAEAMDEDTDYMTGLSSAWMDRAQTAGLGTNDLKNIELVELKVD